MGEEAARLRSEIDQTREDLTRDVDLIAAKTSPSRIIDRRMQRARRGLSNLKERVMGSNDDMAGYGPYRADPRNEEYGRRRAAGADDESGAHDAPDVAKHVRGALRSSHGAVAAARGRVGSVGESLVDATTAANDRAKDHTVGNPLAAGLVAFGIGWLVSSVLPASRTEVRVARRAQETASAHSGPVMEQAKAAAADIGDDLRGSAQEAVDQVKDHAREAVRTVEEKGSSAAHEVVDAGSDAVQQVRGGQAQETGGTTQARQSP